LLTFAATIFFPRMDHLKHYTALADNLASTDPQAHETLEEEINILIHKLKFIPMESRPVVLLQNLSASQIEPDYLEEILAVAGGRKAGLENDLAEIDILIFIQESPDFLSKLPSLLSTQYHGSKAVENNQVYIIQKPAFGSQRSDYLQDIEILAEIVQSKYFIYGHEGSHWMKFGL